ncbi:MAG: PKD domain-containing protein [Pedobacter sp.]|jgi:gliding motility-associated-like protein|uniref:PKD domain-containing protein n=1 Tax=Pedobacter sp. TaxID=1411316 RepID=UPI0035632430
MCSKLLIGNALAKKLCLAITLFLLLGFSQNALAQNISNEGMEFWTVFPTHDPSSSSLATMNVNITSKFDSEVTVSCGTSLPQTKLIPANTVVTFLVSRSDSYIDGTESNNKLVNRGIHIVVTPGKPKVVAYSHVFAGFRSAATLILPYEALGQKYYSMNYTQDRGIEGECKNFLVLIAANDSTNLILHKIDGSTISIPMLNKGDVYEYMPLIREDLTGVFVEVDTTTSNCKRFAAFSGSTSVSIGCANSRDPLFQQLYATNSWGKTYGVIPFINRRYIVRVLAQENNTSVTLDGALMGVINKGQYLERTLIDPVIVSADKLISVAEYSFTENCSDINGRRLTGDPEMVLLNPIEFNIKNITVFSSDKNVITEKYINVFMKTSKVSTFKLNGNARGSWQIMPSDPNYAYLQLPVYDESLTLTADDGFNAIAYGFGQTESYAYSAGTNLASTQFLILVNKVTGNENAGACLGEESDFKLTLPYKLDRLIWKYGDGTVDSNIPNPTFTTNGTSPVLYTYTAPVSKTFTVAGKTQITAIATLSATAGSCSTSDIELNFTFDVDSLPTAKFTAATEKCANQGIIFTDASNANADGKVITKWQWDFGDPASGALNTSAEQKPKHTFTAPGTYTVKLFVSAENGCMSDVFPQDIIIYPVPDAKFTVPSTCINTSFTFTDQSTISTAVFADAKIVNWHWDFGDGVSEDRPDSSTPNHQYIRAGTYTITLTTTSNKGCTSTISHPIVITGLPIADFSTPDFCLADGFANFINKSKDQNGSEVGLTYVWDFGDPASGAANSSTQKDGKHAYNAIGNYTVKLTITNVNGCTDEKSYPFTVNGAVVKADFTIKNEANLCSGNDVIINSTSAAAFGSITKVEIYQDFVNNPTSFITIPYPKLPISDDIPLTYAPFGGNTNKTYTIKLVAYSGESCTLSAMHNITIKPAPQLTFTPIPAVCENVGDIIVNQATENSGINGAGVYSGTGIKPDGTFDPKLAGPGIHHIIYTFTPQNGCTVSIGQDIEVYPIPITDAGADFYILVGGEKKMQANATGTGLTYKWTPSIGLSADDILNPIAKPETDTQYTLTVTSDQGCTTVDQVYVHVLQNVNAPNSFTPNGDGVNDVWNVKYLDTYPNSNVEIFDRNGQRVFFSKGYAVPFDGNYKNQALPVGTYYYIINPNSGRKSITGNLTIIR